jgi:hypothetical protein
MKVEIGTPFRVSHLERYGVMERGNVTSVYPSSPVTGQVSYYVCQRS